MKWPTLLSRNAVRKTEEAFAPGGPVKRIRPARHVKATIQLPPGVAFDDLVAGTVKSSIKQRIEAAAGWPPDSMVVVPNIDNAQYVDVTISDPRILRNPVPWEGPSWTDGASIADSISIGMYQDGTECEVEVPETQIQVMGQVGSGKSLGGAWNALSEMITRDDCVVWGIDIKKGLQTLGPLQAGLHRIATTPAEAIDMLSDANNLITPRTDYLSSEGLGKWYRGCKLKYLVLWIEEAPYVMTELGSKGIKTWTETVKAARSAGITVAWSLQRADFKEIPTVTRGQATKWCFGVQDVKESNFGLSAVQKERGCHPQIWGQRRPGMSYIDAPNITEAKVATPLRAWWWGKNDKLIREHAAKYPWQERPYDDLMTEYFDKKSRGEVIVSGLGIAQRPPKMPVAPVLNVDTPDGERQGDQPRSGLIGSEPTSAPRMTHMDRGAIGRKMWDDFLRLNPGKMATTQELMAIATKVGLGYEWMKKQRNLSISNGKLKKHGTGKAVTWEIIALVNGGSLLAKRVKM